MINDGTGDEFIGNYNLQIFKEKYHLQKWKEGRVENFHRKRDTVWKLLFYALGSMLQGKVKKCL